MAGPGEATVGTHMSRARIALCLLALAGGLLVPSPATAASVAAVWRAEAGWEGAWGATTLTLFTTGNGSAVIDLRALPKRKAVTVAIRTGSCDAQGATIVTLSAGRAGTTGTAKRTVRVAAATMARIVAAPTLVAVVRAGSLAICGDLVRGRTAPAG